MSAKRGKSSKAEREKAKKEEEERRLQEEEEEKKRLAEEERERKKREKQEAIERAKREKQLAILRNEEHDELRVKLAEICSQLAKTEQDKKEAQEWNRYVRCDGTPDPTILGQINTYINLCKDDAKQTDFNDLLDKNILTLSLIEELRERMRATIRNRAGRKLIEQYEQTSRELQNLLQYNIDDATQHTLERAVYLADKDSGNLQIVKKTENQLMIALWANLAKNAKIRSFMFDDEGVGFEIPRIMATSDVSIRFVLTRYDHHSYRALSHPPIRRRVKMPELPDRVEIEPDPEPVPEEEEKPDDDPLAALYAQNPAPPEPEPVVEEPPPEETEEEKVDEGAEKAVEEEPEAPPVDLDIEIPDEIQPDPYAGDGSVISLRQWMPIYGVLYIDLLSVPPQPISANGWVMKQVVDKKLLRLDFEKFVEPTTATEEEGGSAPQEASAAVAAPAEGEEGGENKEEQPAAVTAAVTAENSVKVSFRLPSCVSVPEAEIQVGHWCEEKLCWKINGISDVQFDKETMMISWKTSVFGAFCCFQDCYVNMPLQQWEVRPKDLNHCIITIISTVAELEIEVKDDLCRLNYHEDRDGMIKELIPICDKWVDPLQAIDMLTSIGINVFPQKYSSDYVSICEKDGAAEAFVYQQMALTASAMAFAWSRFNAEEGVDSSKIVIQAHEQLAPLPPTGEEEWSLLLLAADQMRKLAIDEFSDSFSDELAAGQEVHFDMVHLVKPWVTEESMSRIENTSAAFIDTVYQLLSATKLITFS